MGGRLNFLFHFLNQGEKVGLGRLESVSVI